MVPFGDAAESMMSDEMGTFRTTIEIENPSRRGLRRALDDVLVDTGAELSWVPAPVLESLRIARDKPLRFRQANGEILDRWTGVALDREWMRNPFARWIHHRSARPLPDHHASEPHGHRSYRE